MRGFAATATLLLAAAATASAEAPAGAVAGRVSTHAEPLSLARVYAYELADLSLEKVTTDTAGSFRFDGLPAGLYKIIAYKTGFLPAVALLTRASAEASQYLDLELTAASEAAYDSDGDFWSIRQQVPGDVMRRIEILEARAQSEGNGRSVLAREVTGVRAAMSALAGVDGTESAQSQVTGGQVDVDAALADVDISLHGNYMALAPANQTAFPTVTGRSQRWTVDLHDRDNDRVRVTTLNNKLDQGSEPGDIDFQSHRVSWTRTEERSRSDLAAQYTTESNFYERSGFGPLGLPGASRAWKVEGSYSTALGDRHEVEAGFRYRQLDTDPTTSSGWLLPEERVELFGRAGMQVNPAVLVEYGVYSTMRDGSLSLMPQGGVVLRVGPQWRATTTAAVKVHEEPTDGFPVQDFSSAYFHDYAACDRAAEYCYQVLFSRFQGDREQFSVGALTRKFDESLQLHFDEDFFNYGENLFLVQGDSVPELQLEITQHLTPKILTQLRSHLGFGGGGTLFLTDSPYENEVRYLVTSLDTQFQQTATGVFVAFHQLQQRLSPLDAETQALPQEVQLERLQLMLTQELGTLHALASDFAVRLSMELSRGALVSGSAGSSDVDELRRRITGGLAVRF